MLDVHARVALQQGHPVEALRSLSRLIALEPANAELRSRFQGILQAHEGLIDAPEILEPIVRRDPENPRWRAALGRAYARQDRVEEASREIAEALRLRPDDPEILEEHASLLARSGKHDEAIAAFENVLTRSQDRTRIAAVWAVLLDLYERADRLEEVRAALEARTSSDPRDWRPHYQLAELHRRTGDEAAARRVAREALDRVPAADSVYFRQQRINELLRAGDPAAETELRRAIELEPGNGVLYQQLANHLSRRGRHREAREILETGLAATRDETILPAMRETLERIRKLEDEGR